MSIFSDALEALSKAGAEGAAQRTLSPSELAVIQAKYPGRIINPTTGQPMAVRGASGKFEPAMMEGAGEEVNVDGTTALVPKPDVSYQNLLDRANEIARNAASRTTEAFQPQLPRNPETGAVIPRRNPVTGRMEAPTPEYSPTQKAVAIGAGTAASSVPLYHAFTGDRQAAASDTGAKVDPWGEPVNVSGPQLFTNTDYKGEPIAPTYDMTGTRPAVSTAKSVMSRQPAPAPAPAPADRASIPSARSLWDVYNQSGSAADFVRASNAQKLEDAAMARAQAETDASTAKTEKRGGSVTSDGHHEVYHKALEIIHHIVKQHGK
jgi:hypothetical protein